MTSGHGATLKIHMRFFTILNMQYIPFTLYNSNIYPPNISYTLPIFLMLQIKSNILLFLTDMNSLYPGYISDALPIICIPNQYFQYPIKTRCTALYNFEFPISCVHFQYSLNISQIQCLALFKKLKFTLDNVTMRHPVDPVSPYQ